MEIGLIENIQRENLNAIEEAEGYQRLLNEFDYTQEELSQVLGKSRSAISNTVRLLQYFELVDGQRCALLLNRFGTDNAITQRLVLGLLLPRRLGVQIRIFQMNRSQFLRKVPIFRQWIFPRP